VSFARWRFALVTLFCGAAFAGTPGDDLRARILATPSGGTVDVPAGVYEGHFVLEKSIHLIGSAGAVLRGDGAGSVVAIRGADVELAGFVIRGSGKDLTRDDAGVHVTGARAIVRDNRIVDTLHGIYVRKADGCRLLGNNIRGDLANTVQDAAFSMENLQPADAELCGTEAIQDRRGNGIHLWNSSGHVIAHNLISGTRDGIYFSFADNSLITDNVVTGVRYGLHYMYSDGNTFERNLFSENAAGAALMYSNHLVLRDNRFLSNRSHRAYGLLLQAVDDTQIEGNRIEGNTAGLYIENSNNDTVRANVITANYVALRVSDSTSGCRFFENRFRGNIHPIETSGLNRSNTWAVAGRGNYWDDALAVDLNHDGVADVAHRETDVFGQWRRIFPAVGLLSASPGERLLRFIHNRLALPGLSGVTDPKPLLGR